MGAARRRILGDEEEPAASSSHSAVTNGDAVDADGVDIDAKPGPSGLSLPLPAINGIGKRNRRIVSDDEDEDEEDEEDDNSAKTPRPASDESNGATTSDSLRTREDLSKGKALKKRDTASVKPELIQQEEEDSSSDDEKPIRYHNVTSSISLRNC